MGLTKFAL